MAFDEGVAERLRSIFAGHADIVEKQMFGGLAFMHAGNMCCGIIGDVLMARVGPTAYAEALKQPYVREMDFTGKAMKGFVYVDPAGFSEDDDLLRWIHLCQAFTATLPEK